MVIMNFNIFNIKIFPSQCTKYNGWCHGHAKYNKYYKAFEEKKSWDSAQDYCQKVCKYGDGRLAVPKDKITNLFISNVVPLKDGFYWVGGFRNVEIEESLSKGVAVIYKHNIYSLKFFHSWFLKDGDDDDDCTPVWSEPDKCLAQHCFPYIPCNDPYDFNAFAVGKTYNKKYLNFSLLKYLSRRTKQCGGKRELFSTSW